MAEVLADEMGSGLFRDPWPEGSNRPHGTTFATPVRGGYGGRTSSTTAGATARGGRPRLRATVAECNDVIADIVKELGIEDDRIDIDEVAKLRRTQVKELAIRVRTAIEGTISNGFYVDDDLCDDLKTAIEELVGEEKKFEAARTVEERRGWKDWLESDWGKGGRKAHAATRLPNEWRPTTATDDSGVVSASPCAILEAARNKYSKY